MTNETKRVTKRVTIVKIHGFGVTRVLRGEEGMPFEVDKFSEGVAGPVAHVRDYRFGGMKGYQIWSIPADGYEILCDSAKAEGVCK